MEAHRLPLGGRPEKLVRPLGEANLRGLPNNRKVERIAQGIDLGRSVRAPAADVLQRRDANMVSERLGLSTVVNPDLLGQLDLLGPDLNLPRRAVHVRVDAILAGREALVKRSLGAHNE